MTKICVKCGIELRPETIGAVLVKAAVYGFDSIYSCDVDYCPTCGLEVVFSVSQEALFRHWEGDIVAEIKRREARGERIIICWLNEREKKEFLKRGIKLEQELRS